MKANWVFSATYSPDPTIDLGVVKNIGSTWGSWKSWRACQTDNVICNSKKEIEALLSKSFQNSCNFYIPEKFYQEFGEPPRVRAYQGEFNEPVVDIEDVIAMHLAANDSDLVLLCGFDFALPRSNNSGQKHRLGIMRHLIYSTPAQWVAVDYDQKVDDIFSLLPNFTCDKIENVLHLLSE